MAFCFFVLAYRKLLFLTTKKERGYWWLKYKHWQIQTMLTILDGLVLVVVTINQNFLPERSVYHPDAADSRTTQPSKGFERE